MAASTNGFGYTGEGYHGGYWRDNQFYYNRAVNNLGPTHVASFFNQVPTPVNHVSFNGGNGGTTARPTQAQMALARERHIGPTPEQVQHQQAASRMASLKYNANHGNPRIAALQRPNAFHGVHEAAAGGAANRVAGAVTPHPEAHVIRPHAAPMPAQAPATRGPAMARNLAPHAPAMRMGGPPMHMGGPAFAHIGGPRMAGGPHIGGGPSMAGGPHVGGPGFRGGPRMGGGPHIGGGGPGGHRVP